MKCHYSYYIERGKKHRLIIPGCMNVTHSNDIKDCTCQDPLTELQFERKRFNDVVKILQDEIKDLQSENKYLLDIIKQLKQNGKEKRHNNTG
jgi:hypothetical protein